MRKTILLGAVFGLFAAYCARSIRLLAWTWAGAEVQGVVLIEGLLSDITGAFAPGHFVVGASHFAFGALAGLAIFASPKHLLGACLAGEIILLAILTPVDALPNTNLDPLGAIAVASFWLLLGFAGFVAARRPPRTAEAHTAEHDSLSIHCTAHS